MIDLNQFKDYPQVSKAWGLEIWLCNNPLYCAKLLVLQSGWKCSLHMHKLKTETFIVLEGEVAIEAGPLNYLVLSRYTPGQSLQLDPGTYHCFYSLDEKPALILEVSTHHDDEDVVRARPSGRVEDVF